MKNNKPLLNHAIKAGILSLTLFSATQVHAVSQPESDFPFPTAAELHIQADADGNGMISAEEFYALHTATALMEFSRTFKVIDENGDGEVSSAEFTNFLPAVDEKLAQQRFMDAAGDDELMNDEEFSIMRLNEQGGNNALWAFASIDQDHDGQLSPKEFGIDQPTPDSQDSQTDIEEAVQQAIEDAADAAGVDISDGIDTIIIKPPTVSEPDPNNEGSDSSVDIGTEGKGEADVNTEDHSDTHNGAEIETEVDTGFEVLIGSTTIGPPRPNTEQPSTDDNAKQSVTDAETATENQIAELQAKLERAKHQLGRLNKSILMTKKRLENATSDGKQARLERRLARQMTRLEKMLALYQMAEDALNAAQ